MTDLAVVPGAVAGELEPLRHLHLLDELLVVHHHGRLHVRVPRLTVPDTSKFHLKQCWGSVTFWCGSGSGSPDRIRTSD